MFAALYVFIAVGGVLFVVNLVALLRPRPLVVRANSSQPIRKFLDSYTEMTADLTLLLATLAIMTGALVITGVPTKLGALLIEAAGVNLAAMVVLAFIFGAHARHRPAAGADLHPGGDRDRAADDQGRRQSVGGAFLRVLPRRLGRAHAADLAGRRRHRQDRQCVVLHRRSNRALQICVSLFTLMAGVFVHPELVIEPGLSQIRRGAADPRRDHRHHLQPAGAVLRRIAVDRAIRFVLAAFALVVLLCPDERIGTAACLPVLLFIGYWLAWRRTAADATEVVAAPVLVPVVPVIDTERGRMS